MTEAATTECAIAGRGLGKGSRGQDVFSNKQKHKHGVDNWIDEIETWDARCCVSFCHAITNVLMNGALLRRTLKMVATGAESELQEHVVK